MRMASSRMRDNEDNELEDELADAADSAVPAQRTPERR